MIIKGPRGKDDRLIKRTVSQFNIGGRMNELSKMHCISVKADSPSLNGHEIDQMIEQLPGWHTAEKESELRLEKLFKFKDFSQAVAFTDQVARAANEEDHHPAILTEWGKVTVTWWTHAIKGLHQNDFIMAAKTEDIYKGSNQR